MWEIEMTREEVIRLAKEADEYVADAIELGFPKDQVKELRDERFAALVAAAEREECANAQTKWLPIETAPKEGTEILVMHVCIETQIVHNAFWIEDEDDKKETGWWSYEHSEVSRIKLDDWLTPTHWMPLPSDPD